MEREKREKENNYISSSCKFYYPISHIQVGAGCGGMCDCCVGQSWWVRCVEMVLIKQYLFFFMRSNYFVDNDVRMLKFSPFALFLIVIVIFFKLFVSFFSSGHVWALAWVCIYLRWVVLHGYS